MSLPFADDIDRLYREAFAAAEGGREYAGVRAEIAGDVADLLDTMTRDRIGEAARYIDAVVKPIRRHRRDSIRTQLEYILDSLFISGDEGANIDPLLDVPYPLGRVKGEDKALRYWTVEDFRDMVQTAYRNASDVTAAARALDETIQKVIDAMNAHSAETFGDLNDDEDDDDQ